MAIPSLKVRPKIVDCVFIGYENNSSAYRFLVHKSRNPDMYVNTIIESRNASFFEHIFPWKKNEKFKTLETEEISSKKRTFDAAMGGSEDHNDNEAHEPRYSKMARISKLFGLDFLTYLLENEPQNFMEAMSSLEAPLWRDAVNSEIESILQNHTWELVDLPPGSKHLDIQEKNESRWFNR